MCPLSSINNITSFLVVKIQIFTVNNHPWKIQQKEAGLQTQHQWKKLVTQPVLLSLRFPSFDLLLKLLILFLFIRQKKNDFCYLRMSDNLVHQWLCIRQSLLTPVKWMSTPWHFNLIRWYLVDILSWKCHWRKCHIVSRINRTYHLGSKRFPTFGQKVNGFSESQLFV